MANIIGRPTVTLRIVFEVTEDEARALDALSGYGDDSFIEAFYEKLGKAYMQKHEGGLRTFLTSVREFIPGWLAKADAARKALANASKGAWGE